MGQPSPVSAAGAGAGGQEPAQGGRAFPCRQCARACVCVCVHARVLTAHVPVKWGQGRQGGRRLTRHAAPCPQVPVGVWTEASCEPTCWLRTLQCRSRDLHSQEAVAGKPTVVC